MSDDETFVICQPYSLETMLCLPGNKKGSCGDCRRALVIGKSAREHFGAELLALCMDCATKRNPGAIAAALPGDREKLVERLGPDIARSIDRLTGMPIGEIDFDYLKEQRDR